MSDFDVTIEAVRRPRLLMLAYACGPGRGSEPGVGWHRALQAARYADTCVLCEQHEFAASIEQYLAEHGQIPGLSFYYVPRRKWEAWLSRIPGLFLFVNRLWQRRALRTAQQLHQKAPFDLVHHATLGTFREPGYAWQLDIPFVWGPWGGTQNLPWRFMGEVGPGVALFEGLRNLTNLWQLHFSRRVAVAARKASAVLTANQSNQADFARAQGIVSQIFPDTGLEHVSTCPLRQRAPHDPLRILWSGLLIPRKALGLLIKALALLPADLRYEVRVVGRGPMQRQWQKLAERLGVAEHIQWLGWVPHATALEQYAWADVFAFTSLRDTTGTVMLEALGAGLPVLGLDHQGVRDVVTDRCGVRVPVTTPAGVIQGLAAALTRLGREPQWNAELSRGARQRAEEFLWNRHGERMAEVYRRVLAGVPQAEVAAIGPSCVPKLTEPLRV